MSISSKKPMCSCESLHVFLRALFFKGSVHQLELRSSIIVRYTDLSTFFALLKSKKKSIFLSNILYKTLKKTKSDPCYCWRRTWQLSSVFINYLNCIKCCTVPPEIGYKILMVCLWNLLADPIVFFANFLQAARQTKKRIKLIDLVLRREDWIQGKQHPTSNKTYLNQRLKN